MLPEFWIGPPKGPNVGPARPDDGPNGDPNADPLDMVVAVQVPNCPLVFPKRGFGCCCWGCNRENFEGGGDKSSEEVESWADGKRIAVLETAVGEEMIKPPGTSMIFKAVFRTTSKTFSSENCLT